VAVAFPGFDEGEIGFEPALHDVVFAIELAGFFAFGNDGAEAGGSVERGDAGAASADAFGESALWDESDLEFAGDDELFEEFVFSHVTPNVGGDHAGFKHEAHAEAIDTHVVADGVKIFDAATD
jgi:hypothetical protein